MPNHITNILVCDNFEALEAILDDEQNIDFNKIVPMPDYIKNTVCGFTVEYEDTSIENFTDRAETRRPLTQEELSLGAGEGWYEWSKRNWGTKWGAYNTKILHYDMYSFQTAWCPPIEFLLQLSERFPSDIFYLYWKDEGCDGGMNNNTIINGKLRD